MCCTNFRTAVFVAAFVGVVLPAYAVPVTFERVYGGPDDDIGFSVQQTHDSGYIMAGATASFGAGGLDIWLVKVDKHGDTLWTRTFGGPDDDVGWSVGLTADSGYVVAGTRSSVATLGDVWLIKTDVNGDTAWTRTYGGPQIDYAYWVQQTRDGGYIVTGKTASFGAGGYDIWLIKTDANGDTLWTRTYGGTGDDEGNSVQQTGDGGYIIAGTTTSFGPGNQRVWLIKTDSVGETLWTRAFGDDSLDFGGSVQQTADSGYFLAGYERPWSSDSTLFYLVKTDARGDKAWSKAIGGSGGWAEGMCGQQVKDGGYIVVGSCAMGLSDVYLIRTDANGDTLWTRTFGGSDLDLGYWVNWTADGGYVIAGQTYSFGAGASDFYLIKTDENGTTAIAEPRARLPRKPFLSLAAYPNPFRANRRAQAAKAQFQNQGGKP